MRGETAARVWSRRAVLRAAGGGAMALPLLSGTARVAAQPAPEPPLLRMLAAVPDRPGLVAGGVTFADLGAVKRRYGFEGIRSLDDLRRINSLDFSNALSGCYTSGNEAQFALVGEYRDLFGYDYFGIDREISVGQPPNLLPRREGVFDPDEIAAKLRDGGYTTVDYRGAAYATVRGDYQIDVRDPRGRFALARLNRVAADRGRLVSAGATGTMETALDAEAGRVPVLAANPAFRALALALGDVTSVATLDEEGIIQAANVDRIAAQTLGGRLPELPRDWTPLRPSSLVAVGYTDKGNDERVMHAARVYANADDARADAPELERRLREYTLVRNGMPLIPTYATGVTVRTEAHEGLGVLVADIALTPTPVSARLWIQMYTTRDTLFLVPDLARFVP